MGVLPLQIQSIVPGNESAVVLQLVLGQPWPFQTEVAVVWLGVGVGVGPGCGFARAVDTPGPASIPNSRTALPSAASRAFARPGDDE
jgi:hypothetical protein